MKKDELFWNEIVSEIKEELKSIEALQAELKATIEDHTLPVRRIQGSIMQDFYNCCERIFKRIACEINSGFNERERWHKALLYRMTIPIEGIRPFVISKELAAELDDYLSFRHVFRNIYGFELRGERLDRLVEKFEEVSTMFTREVLEFLKQIEKGE